MTTGPDYEHPRLERNGQSPPTSGDSIRRFGLLGWEGDYIPLGVVALVMLAVLTYFAPGPGVMLSLVLLPSCVRNVRRIRQIERAGHRLGAGGRLLVILSSIGILVGTLMATGLAAVASFVTVCTMMGVLTRGNPVALLFGVLGGIAGGVWVLYNMVRYVYWRP